MDKNIMDMPTEISTFGVLFSSVGFIDINIDFFYCRIFIIDFFPNGYILFILYTSSLQASRIFPEDIGTDMACRIKLLF